MRIITFDGGHLGAVAGDDVWDLTARLGLRSVTTLLASGLAPARQVMTGAPDRKLGELSLGLPTTDPGQILCVGVNYMRPGDPYRQGDDAPEYPTLFHRTMRSLVADGQDLWRPPESERFDYEGEIVLVIGRPGRRIPEADAHAHIAGLTVMNEGSVRDWMRHAHLTITPGKNFERSGALGPWIETDLSGIDLENLTIRTRVNGELRQEGSTADMLFPFARIIAYASRYTELLPGDLIATGTPAGQGQSFDPPKWLVPDDRVEIELEGVGTLSNPVIDEPG
ncbi:MAG: fumarylacetoacetate hydrolase family protein [Pseudomonadota bacterium]